LDKESAHTLEPRYKGPTTLLSVAHCATTIRNRAETSFVRCGLQVIRVTVQREYNHVTLHEASSRVCIDGGPGSPTVKHDVRNITAEDV
jgi:hypothetical protein